MARTLSWNPQYIVGMKTSFVTAGFVSAGLACAVFSACVAAAPMRTWGLDAAGAQRVGASCRTTMGLIPGNAWYNACADSLSRTLQSHAAAVDLAAAHEVCARRGLGAQTPELARCVIERSQSQTAARPIAVVAEQLSKAAPEGPPFRSLTRAERLHREQLSCADLGLDPVTPEFNACVVSLTQAFFNLDNPR